MSALASATRTAGGGVALQFPYREDLVDDLKEQIPARFRHYDRDAKCWLILGAYAPTAVALLLEHFPRADVPGDAPRRMTLRVPSTPARTEPPATPGPALIVVPPPADDPPPLIATIVCPRCQTRLAQPIRVRAQSAEVVAKREQPPAEFVLVCPGCQRVLVVGVAPALAQEAA